MQEEEVMLVRKGAQGSRYQERRDACMAIYHPLASIPRRLELLLSPESEAEAAAASGAAQNWAVAATSAAGQKVPQGSSSNGVCVCCAALCVCARASMCMYLSYSFDTLFHIVTILFFWFSVPSLALQSLSSTCKLYPCAFGRPTCIASRSRHSLCILQTAVVLQAYTVGGVIGVIGVSGSCSLFSAPRPSPEQGGEVCAAVQCTGRAATGFCWVPLQAT